MERFTNNSKPWPLFLVFSDLDGTLLDHHDYSYQAARPALDLLEKTSTPLVMVSSKTRVEIEALRREMGTGSPFIPENGAAVFIPEDYPLKTPEDALQIDEFRVILLGRPAAEISRGFDRLAAEFPIRALSRLPLDEVVSLTGLSRDQAAGAVSREFGEALVLDDPETSEKDLARAAADLGFRLTRGGRFFHLMGDNDKGRAARLLTELYRTQNPDLVTAAVGDAPNDEPLLTAVDRGFLVAGPDGEHRLPEIPGVTRVPEIGPAGFNRVVLELLSGPAEIPGSNSELD